MMFAKNLKPGQTVKISPEDGGEILHISQVCMSKPVDNNRTYLKVVQGSQSFAACVLQKDKTESCSVDLFLSAREGIQLALEGGKNELSVIGYFEPEPESESDGDNEMAGFGEDSEEESEDVSEDETDGMTAPVDGRIEDLDAQEEESKKKGKTPNNKKAQALKALQAAAANDDEEDDDDDEDQPDSDSGDASDSDGEEESEQEEEASEEETPAPAPQEKKRKGQQQQQQQGNKKAKGQNNDAAAPASGKGDEAAYKNALVDFLKKNGPTPLASLGQKVKKPASLPKMAAFLKSHANVFVVEGGKCSLK